MASPGIAARVHELAEPIAEELGVELLEVKYAKEGPNWVLRLIIDKVGGITLDDCEAVSRAVDPVIDAEVEIRQAYNLEVQSPGLDRPLKTQADFKRYQGQEVELKFYKARDNQKLIKGILQGSTEESIILRPEGLPEDAEFLLADVATVKRVIHF